MFEHSGLCDTEMFGSYGNTVIKKKKALDPSLNKKPRHFGGVSSGI